MRYCASAQSSGGWARDSSGAPDDDEGAREALKAESRERKKAKRFARPQLKHAAAGSAQ